MHGGSHTTRGPLRALIVVTRLFTSLLFALLTLFGALALSVSAPTSVAEGQALTVSLSGPGQLGIWIDGTLAAQGTSTITHTKTTDGSSAGLYEYRFTTTDPTHTNETRTIEVTNVPLQMTIASPTASEVSTASVAFALSTNWAPELCYVTIDGASHTLAATSPTTFAQTLTLTNGVHDLVYKCKLGGELPNIQRSLLVDTKPPIVTSTGPGGDQTGTYVTLTVDTDEIAQCHYGETDGEYTALPESMGTTYALRNTATIPITEQGAKTYFVRCKDVHGNTMTSSAIISFLTKLAPTADISLEEADDPLIAGTYTLRLESNTPLITTPTLTYVLQDSGKTGSVSLSGEEDAWRGIITIPEGTENTLIQFSFEGKSLQNVIGKEITDGASFAIDALPPPAVDALTATQTPSGIRLTWFMKKEEEKMTYNVYRADHEGVSYTDLLATTRHLEYTDMHARDARYYYYRIAAVDAAGNIGPLSQEVWGSQIDTLLAEQAVDPLQLAQIDDEIIALTTALLDANRSIDQLSSEPDAIKASIIADMGYLETARTARAQLEASLAQLRSLAQAEQYDALALETAKSARTNARKAIIQRITPQSQLDITQPYDESALVRNMPYALGSAELTKRERTAFETRAKEMNQHLTVSVHARSFSVANLAGGQEEITFVRKEISYDAPQEDSLAIEVIPKEVAASASEMIFSPMPSILEDDPVVSFPLTTGERASYTYTIKRIVPMEAVRASRTLLYPKMTLPALEDEASSLTGLAIADLPMPGLDGILIAAGIIIVLGLAVYYISLSRPKTPFRGAKAFTARPLPQQVVRPVQERRSAARAPQIIMQRPPIVLDETLEDPIALLQQAEKQIDAKAYDASLASYRRVIAAVESDAQLHTTLDAQIVRVYKKLMLFKYLDEARRAIDSRNVPDARRALESAKSLAHDIGDEHTRLTDDASAAFSTFVRSLNTLEIERAGVY